MSLLINEIFYSIQGEGFFIGHPAVFIRLAGCNLACPFCDTDHSEGKAMTVNDILTAVEDATAPRKAPFAPLAVVTGGEPFTQDLRGILSALEENGFSVQIETNGTLDPSQDVLKLLESATVICSPKNDQLISPALALYIDAFKILVQDGDPVIEQKANMYAVSGRPVFVQPIYTESKRANEKNMAFAIELCKNFGFILSPQLQRMIGVK